MANIIIAIDKEFSTRVYSTPEEELDRKKILQLHRDATIAVIYNNIAR